MMLKYIHHGKCKIVSPLIRTVITICIACCSDMLFASTPPIRIALVGPFTGSYAAYGTLLLSGASEAINDINQAGGVGGVHLEVVPIDDQCNPDLALAQAEQIVRNKQFHAVIGHACSSSTLATLKVYAQANILVITPTSTNPQITQHHIATIFRMIGKDDQQSAVAANFMVNKLHSKRIAILHDQELYSKDLADLVSEQLLHLNTTPILYQAIPRGTRNFTQVVKKLKLLKAEAVYFAGLYPEVSTLAKALKVLELQIPLVSADAIALNQFVSAAGGASVASSVLMTSAREPKGLISSKAVIHAMQQKHLETNSYSLYTYAAVQVLAKAIESVNNTDGAILASWLHQHEVDTVLGKKSWDTNGDIINSEFKMYAWQGKKNLEIVAQ